MSLGWQTESALLPSNAKKIEVDSKSILGLKALVYEKEQHRNASSKESIARYQKNNRSRNGDHLIQKNKGIEERKRRDEIDSSNRNKSDAVVSSLKAKASIYDSISKGAIPVAPQVFLVDFQNKSTASTDDTTMRHRNESEKKISVLLQQITSDERCEDFVEIVDAFGRTRRVSKDSAEYEEFKIQEDAKTFKQAMKEKLESNRRLHGNNELKTDHGDWAWSSGRERDEGTGDWIEDALRKRCYSDLVQDAIDKQGAEVSKGSRVKTVWEEKKFDADTRLILDNIHADTLLHRAGVKEKQSGIEIESFASKTNASSITNMKSSRLDLLKKKLEEKPK